MTEVFSDPTAEGMVSAVEISLVSTWLALGAPPLLSIESTPEITRYATGVHFPLLNGVLTSRLPPGREDEIIAGTVAYFRERGLPMTWWAGPWCGPPDLPQRLEAAGLKEATRQIGMAIDLWSLTAMIGKPVSLTIEEVEDAEGYRTCQEVLNSSFELPTEAGEALYRLVADCGFGEESPFRHFLGVKEGRPVATATLSLTGGVAGIYNSTVLPDEHAMGIHTAMILTALYQAQALEYRVGVVQATRLGFNAFRHLGFLQSCEVSQYVWQPAGSEPPAA